MSQDQPIEISDDEQPEEKKLPEPARKRKGDAYHGQVFRNWFFTWNNPTMPTDKDRLLKWRAIKYIIFQLEEGDSGTPHLQGMLMLRNATSCSAIQKKFDHEFSFLEPLKSEDGASKYCGKTKGRLDGPWEAGKRPEQGRRTDLEDIKTIIDTGGSVHDAFNGHFGSMVRYHSGVRVYHGLVNRTFERTWQTSIYVLWGKAGTGKSHFASICSEHLGGGTYHLNLQGGMNKKVWWTGYDRQENIIIDEFGCQVNLQDFNKMCDRQPWMVPIHGGMTQFLGKRIFITSNQDPYTWYHRCEPHRRDAFLGRIGYKIPDATGTPSRRPGSRGLIIKFDTLYHGMAIEDFTAESQDLMDTLEKN